MNVPDASAVSDADADGPFDRLMLEKQFHGDLEGESAGQMLGSGSPDEGSAGYVALEREFGYTLEGSPADAD